MDLGEHAYIAMNSASIVMEVFTYPCYVGKWERVDKEKLRRKKEYGIIEAQDKLELVKVLLICFNHEIFNYLLFY